MAPSEGVRLFSEMSTDPPSASARFYSDMTTQEPRSELHALSVDNSLASLSCQDAAVQYIVSPAENSASGEGVPQVEAAFTRREVLQFACNFIASHTDAVLRKVLKASRRKVSGSKVERISRAFLYLRVRIKGGEEEAEVFGRCRKAGLCLFRDYEDWLNENKGSCGSLMDVPPDEDLMRTFKQVEVSHWEELEALAEQRRQMGEDGELSDGASGSVGGSGYRGPASSRGIRARTEVIQFTLAYFVRLCILLRDDPVAKLAFRGTGLELTMEQQRNRVNRDDNWHTVAERFNSSDFQPRFEVPHGLPLENIEPSPTPVPPVSGIKLKTAWMDMRRPFTKANKDFERSGQNVTTLRGTLRFLKTKNGLPDGELYAIPKRILVMFIVLRIGSDNKGTDDQGETAKAMLNQALRMIPNGGGFDEAGNQNRSGSATSASEGDCEDDSSSPSSKKRKTSAISEDKRFLCMHLKGLTDSINIREAGSDGAYLAEFEESEKLLDMLQRAQDQLKIAERAAEDGNDVVLKLRKVRFDKVREQYERKFGEAA